MPTAEKPNVLDFKQIDKKDTNTVGGKSANLGEMVISGFPVPPGFSTTTHAYDKFVQENDLIDFITQKLKQTDTEDTEKLVVTARQIRQKILRGHIPKDVAKDIISHYKKLSGRFRHARVAVRSSATAEDSPSASFAGQQVTLLNIKGEANLINAVRQCFASLFTARSIFYRQQNKIPHEKVKVAVAIQMMIQSEVSGVMFTIDPVSNQKDRILIEAVWGLGELIVQGSVIPDRYMVQKETFDILYKQIAEQKVQLIQKGTKTQEHRVPDKISNQRKLSDDEIIEIAKLGYKLQQHYYFPQDIEWGREKGKIYILQTRPITTIREDTKELGSPEASTIQSVLLSGTSASPGIGTGIVRIVKSPNEINKVQKGDVLVAPMTSPDYVPAMKKAVAIVTDQGGATSHAAIVSRELGIPCVVGTHDATTKLSDGDAITVDGKKGHVYLGTDIKIQKEEKPNYKKRKIRTATNLYVNLAEPELAAKTSKLPVDGVGLLRAEFMMANIGIHPKEVIKRKKQQEYINKLTNNIGKFCRNFSPRPVIYRTTDFKTNEYRSLEGGKHWEPIEPNPMLGYRGAFRYISDPEVFALELQVIKAVREKYKNLWVMIPFVRSPAELMAVKRLIAAEDITRSPSFKLWMMVELPINVILLEEFIKVGIDGVSIGSNDLTMLLEGTDRDNEEVATAFNEQSPAVLWALKRVIKSCNRLGVTSSICGQAPSQYDDLVERLVGYGITSISVNPDAVYRVQEVISQAEHKVVKRKK